VPDMSDSAQLAVAPDRSSVCVVIAFARGVRA
jgi:hypothetical protein